MDRATPRIKIKSRAFLVLMPRGKVRVCVTKSPVACHHSLWYNLTFSEDGRSINPEAILFQTLCALKQISSDLVPLNSVTSTSQRVITSNFMYTSPTTTSHLDLFNSLVVLYSVV